MPLRLLCTLLFRVTLQKRVFLETRETAVNAFWARVDVVLFDGVRKEHCWPGRALQEAVSSASAAGFGKPATASEHRES